MRICLDIQPAVAQSAGIGRYARHLMTALARSLSPDELTAFYFDFRRHAHLSNGANGYERPFRALPGAFVQWAWKRLDWPPADRLAGKADLYHFTNFILPPVSRGRTVVTIHDMSFMRYPQFAERRNLAYLRHALPRTIDRADAILAISRFSADEVATFYPDAANRIHATPLGIDATFSPPAADAVKATRERLGLQRPYILSVGTVEPRKNYTFLVDIMERLRAFDGDLVIVGRAGWHCAPILRRLTESTVSARIHHLTGIADGDLPALYAGADAFVTTSHYEGFGFPPLEAMACGTPVVASTGGSLPEVLGDAALLIDGFKCEEWVDKLTAFLDNPDSRATYVQRGRARVARFTWDATAEQTLAVYRSLLS